MTIRRCVPGLLATVLLLGGCATPYHYSELLGRRFHQVTIDTYPVMVVRVDGESTPLNGPVLVEPGLRRVVLEAPSARPGGLGRQEVLELQVQACTRYYLVAQKSAPFVDRFTPRIDHQEPVPGCTARPG